jgi:hypothetical protein
VPARMCFVFELRQRHVKRRFSSNLANGRKPACRASLPRVSEGLTRCLKVYLKKIAIVEGY